MSKLLGAKPCPFCGEENITIREGSTFRWVVAECNNCGARCEEVRMHASGEGTSAEWKIKAEQCALVKWNKRVANTEHKG